MRHLRDEFVVMQDTSTLVICWVLFSVFLLKKILTVLARGYFFSIYEKIKNKRRIYEDFKGSTRFYRVIIVGEKHIIKDIKN